MFRREAVRTGRTSSNPYSATSLISAWLMMHEHVFSAGRKRPKISKNQNHAIFLYYRTGFIVVCAALWTSLFSANAGTGGAFSFENVSELAKKAADEAFRAPPSIPDFLKTISYDDYRDIRFDVKQTLWRERGNFQLQLIHPGFVYGNAVRLNTIEEGAVKRINFNPNLFTYGRNKFAETIPADLGFAGFRIAYPLNQKDEFNHVAVFAGASYFRAVAKGEVFGISGRGLAIDTALPSGEEFPLFTEYWLERPAAAAREMRFYALLDSASVTGAYAFTLRPGDPTRLSVRARLFMRKTVKDLGIAPLTSMFFYGEEKSRPAGEWRPEVHDSDGLLMQSAANEWLWRPLGNPEKLRVSYFDFDSPRGFGLLQRDRSFQDYEDLETRHELRPNAWVIPTGHWGRGFVKLVEIPSSKETNDNIVAYWMPRSAPAPGKPLELSYQLRFESREPTEATGARAVATRLGNGDKEDWQRIVVDFEGAKIRALPESTPVKAVIGIGSEAQLVQQAVIRNAVTGGWRLAFQIKRARGKPSELRAYLQNGKDILTETWCYQLEP
jgi:periplasmic glucans biosynthesis protein